MKISILHYFIILIGTISDAIIELIKRKKNVHTTAQYVIRIAFLASLSLLFNHGDKHYLVYSFILSLIIYWWVFDTSLNILRKKPLWYLSEHGIDAIQRPMEVVFVFKLICAFIASLYFFNPWLYENQ